MAFENDTEREDFLEGFFDGVDDYFYFDNSDYGVSEYEECKETNSILAGMRMIGFTNEDVDNLSQTYQDILLKFNARDSGADWYYDILIQDGGKRGDYHHNRLEKDDLKYLAIAEWERSASFRDRIFRGFMDSAIGKYTKFAVNFDSVNHARGDLFEMGRFSMGIASINPRTDDIIFYNASLEFVTALADSDRILNAEFDDLHSTIWLSRNDIGAANMPEFFDNSNFFYGIEKQVRAKKKDAGGLFHYAMYHPGVMLALESELHLSETVQDYFTDMLCDLNVFLIPRNQDDREEDDDGV